jgi:hypothetical protein
MPDVDRLADAVVLLLKAALAPVAAQLTALRDRVAAVETREPVPGPVGPAGQDGAPGADGFAVDELALEQDAEDPRLITLAYRRGEVRKTLGAVWLPTTLYRGVFHADRTGGYVRGDQVTYAGALWQCNAPTTLKPGMSDAWTLAVKRGDGRC